MEVTFTKGKAGRSCSWTALRPPRTRVPGPTMAAGGDIPHDLATFLIEHELGLRHGFWGAVADGATFRSLRRRRTDRGVAIIRRHRAALDDAEAKVNEIYSAWRAHRPTPLDDVLDRTLAEWRALPEGGELERRWTAGSSGRSARRS